MISVTTKACFQYSWSTGIVAVSIKPMRKASIEMSMTQPGPMREMTWPVVMAAMKPDMATGHICAMVRRGEVPRSSWRIWTK